MSWEHVTRIRVIGLSHDICKRAQDFLLDETTRDALSHKETRATKTNKFTPSRSTQCIVGVFAWVMFPRNDWSVRNRQCWFIQRHLEKSQTQKSNLNHHSVQYRELLEAHAIITIFRSLPFIHCSVSMVKNPTWSQISTIDRNDVWCVDGLSREGRNGASLRF